MRSELPVLVDLVTEQLAAASSAGYGSVDIEMDCCLACCSNVAVAVLTGDLVTSVKMSRLPDGHILLSAELVSGKDANASNTSEDGEAVNDDDTRDDDEYADCQRPDTWPFWSFN